MHKICVKNTNSSYSLSCYLAELDFPNPQIHSKSFLEGNPTNAQWEVISRNNAVRNVLPNNASAILPTDVIKYFVKKMK